MEKTNNIFSLKRVFNLIKMELTITWKEMLLFCAVGLTVFIGLSILATEGFIITGSRQPGVSLVMVAFHPISFFIFAFYYLIRMGRRIHKSDTIAYCSIPVTTLERFVSLIVIMVLYYLLSCLTVQIAYIGEGLYNPAVFRYFGAMGKIQNYGSMNGFLVVNPLFPIVFIKTGSPLILISVIFWGMIRFKHLFYGIFTAFALILTLGYFMNLEVGVGYIISLLITGVAIVASYIALQKLQQRS